MVDAGDNCTKTQPVLTDDEIQAWMDSEEQDLKLPPQSVTTAFREAEQELESIRAAEGLPENADSSTSSNDVPISSLSELLSELVWRVAGGVLGVEAVVKYFASDLPFARRLVSEPNAPGGPISPVADLLCDTLWGIDAMVRKTWTASKESYVEKLKLDERWNRLCSLVHELKTSNILPEKLLLSRLTEELLVGAGIIGKPILLRGKKNPTTVLARTMLRKNTEMLYKQHRFNLQREETEGFAKLLVLLSGVREGNKVESRENLRRLIGYFDLDPNRSLDLTLDALESDPSNRGLLDLVGSFSKDSLPHVVGFKLGHYRDPFVAKVHRARAREALNKKEIDQDTYRERIEKVTPRSLHVLIAVLLSTGLLPVEGLVRHVSPGMTSLIAREKAYMEELEKYLAKAGSKIDMLDEDGNFLAAGGIGSDNSNRLGSMAPLAPAGGYGGSGSLYIRERDREAREREVAREREARRRSAESKANGASGVGGAEGAENEDAGGATKDNQLYGVLEALLDLRSWAVASDVLERLSKAGVDPMRDRSVREAFKRLVKGAMEDLASRYPSPVKLCPPGEKKRPPAVSGSPPLPALPPMPPPVAPEEMEEAEAGEVIPQALAKPISTADARRVSPFADRSIPSPPRAAQKHSSPRAPLVNFRRLPGYGNGFVVTDKLSEAVAVLGPLLKILGPHLGRDPIMFARVCRVLSWVNAANPLSIGSRSKSSSRAGAAPGQANGASASTASSNGTGAEVDTLAPLKVFRSLMGLSPAEAQDLCRRGEAVESGDGVAAVKKELDTRKAAYMRVVTTVAPALGMMHGNPAMQGEVWGMLEHLPYEDRFLVYAAWRGHGMEKQGLGVKHPQYVVAEIASASEISRLIKTLTSDNVKDMARKLGKSSHAHPLMFAEKVLNQLESYDNFITMVADSMRFVGHALGLDCVAYTMVQHICQTNRSVVSDTGLTLERWVGNLSTFAGLLYRKHPETDCQALLCWAVRALGDGGEAAMAAGKVLREVLHQAGGVQVLDGWSITQAQVDGKGGGDVLRQENASFGSTVKPLKNARKSLQDDMEKAGASLPLLVLPAHQTEALLYVGGSLDDQMKGRPQPHLKVLGHRSDETHTTMLQASEFVCSSKAWIRNKCPTIEALLHTYKLQPRVAFHIWRPVINENLMKYWFPKPGTKTEREHREEAEAKRFIVELEAAMPKLLPDASPLTAKLLLVFWALSLPDVYSPTKKYAQVVTNMNDARRRAESKLQQAEALEVTLTKAEKARYTYEKKMCPALATKLELEKSSQSQHVKKVKAKLREIKAALFREGSHASSVDAILKHLVAPRIGMGPEEAYFCAKFFNVLHAIEAAHFNSFLFYSRSFRYLSPTLLCKTQYEAAGLGFFLKDLLENAKGWRSNNPIYTMEAGNRHGFNLGLKADDQPIGNGDAKGKAPQLTHKRFVELSGSWSLQVTKTLLAAEKSDEFLLIKSGLIMYNKIIETFPFSQRERQALCKQLEPMTDKTKEPRDDIRVPCTRIVSQLKKQIAEAAPDPGASAQTAQRPQQPGSTTGGAPSGPGGGAGTNKSAGTAQGKPGAPTAASTGRTVTGLNSRPRAAAPAAASAASSATTASTAPSSGGALSANAKPFVPPGNSSGGSAAVAVKREPPAQAVKKDTGVSRQQGNTAAAAGASKRAREPGTVPTPVVGRPMKTARVIEHGEIVIPERVPGGISRPSATAAGSSPQARAGGGESKGAQASSSAAGATRSTAGATGTKVATTRSPPPTKPAAGGSASASSQAAATRPASSRVSPVPAASADATKQIQQQQQQQQQQKQQQQQRQRSPVPAQQKPKQEQSTRGNTAASSSTSASGSGSGSLARRGSGSATNGSHGGSGEHGSRDVKEVREGREGRVVERDRNARDRERDRDHREGHSRNVSSQEMERPSARPVEAPGSRGTGSLAVRSARDSREPHVPRTNSGRQLSGGRLSASEQDSLGGGRRDSRERELRDDLRNSLMGGTGSHSRGGGSGGTGSRSGALQGSTGLNYADEARGGRLNEDSRSGSGSAGVAGGRSGDGGGRFDNSRLGSSRGDRLGGDLGRSGGGGNSSRGSKRGRSVDADRRSGDRGYDRGGGGEGDPSQAFDSKRMRQPEPAMMEKGGGGSRSAVDGWGQGYAGGSRNSSPLEGSDSASVRYRDDGDGRDWAGSGSGGGGGSRGIMSSRESHPYDGRSGRFAREGLAMDGSGGMDQGSTRDSRGRNLSEDDMRSPRDGGKRSRGERQRMSTSRDRDGGGRKDRKKSSKSKKRKH